MLRDRRVWIIAIVGVSIAGSASLTARVAAIDAQRESWGASSPVMVVAAPIGVGELIGGSVVEREMPLAMLPAGSMSHVSAGSRAKVPLHPGEILIDGRVTGGSVRGLVAGSVALTLPVIAQVPLVGEGDLVDIWMIDSANLSSRRIARRVIVLALSERDITVAVPERHVAEATVASLRPVTVVLVG